MKPWGGENVAGAIIRPLRHNGLPYRGINILMRERTRRNVHLIQLAEKAGCGRTVNIGARHASTEILLIIDSDISPCQPASWGVQSNRIGNFISKAHLCRWR
jgi:hypothetical protein